MSMHLVRMEYQQGWKYNEKIKDEIRDFNNSGSVFYIERFYVNIHKHKLMCYLPNKQYYNKILKAYSNIVMECRGPWNKKHVDILIDHDQSVAVRTKNYWNKYNIKVSAKPHWNMHYASRKKEVEHLKQFFHDNTVPEHTRFQTQRRYGDVVFWTTDAELLSIQPFLQLAHPNTRIHVTRCFLFK